MNREMSWTRPPMPPAGASSGSNASGGMGGHGHAHVGGVNAGGSSGAPAPGSDGVAIDHATGSASGDAYHAAGWTQRFDEESGCFYYHNDKLQRTCWVLPPAP
jgi:hypothetical protein